MIIYIVWSRQIIEHERAARQKLLAESKHRINDRVNRSFGILSHALLWILRKPRNVYRMLDLALILGLLTNVSSNVLNEMMVMTQPGFLQQDAGTKLQQRKEIFRRAELIREQICAKDNDWIYIISWRCFYMMFGRFTERAQKVLALAQEEAVRLGHNNIGTEHILLG